MTCKICRYPDILQDPEGARYTAETWPKEICEEHKKAVQDLPPPPPAPYKLKVGSAKSERPRHSSDREPGGEG